MPQRSSGPYSMADLEKWNEALRILERARMELEMAKEADYPCAQEDAQCQAAREQLMRMKRVYFPGSP